MELLSLEAQLLLPALERSLQAAALGTQPCQLRFLTMIVASCSSSRSWSCCSLERLAA